MTPEELMSHVRAVHAPHHAETLSAIVEVVKAARAEDALERHFDADLGTMSCGCYNSPHYGEREYVCDEARRLDAQPSTRQALANLDREAV
jgi:hypothetical protein